MENHDLNTKFAQASVKVKNTIFTHDEDDFSEQVRDYKLEFSEKITDYKLKEDD